MVFINILLNYCILFLELEYNIYIYIYIYYNLILKIMYTGSIYTTL